MFSVLFEAEPSKEQRDFYLANARMLHPDRERVPGLVDNICYKSRTRGGWILSLSNWRDETSIVGWQTQIDDNELEDEGRGQILAEYRLRVGEVTSDTRAPEDHQIAERELRDREVGGGTYVTLIDARQTPDWLAANNPQEIALYLGFDLYSYGNCISWDVFDAVSSPGAIILSVSWKDGQSANDHAATQIVPDDARVRVVRIVRDYAMINRGETLQHRSDAVDRATIRA